MFKSTAFSLAAAGLMTATAAAQDVQWTYLGEQVTFNSSDEYAFASVCIMPDFTLENSGVPNIASEWRRGVVLAMDLDEMKYHLSDLGCQIYALPKQALDDRPDLMEPIRQRSIPLVDITDALIAADGG